MTSKWLDGGFPLYANSSPEERAVYEPLRDYHDKLCTCGSGPYFCTYPVGRGMRAAFDLAGELAPISQQQKIEPKTFSDSMGKEDDSKEVRELSAYVDYLEKKEEQLRARLAEEELWSCDAAAKISRGASALQRYGRHDSACGVFHCVHTARNSGPPRSDPKPCSCGLDEIIKSL